MNIICGCPVKDVKKITDNRMALILKPENIGSALSDLCVTDFVYGLEVILPEQKLMDILERTNKKFLKHIPSLPITTADPAVYVLTGSIPTEGVIHKRALSLFGNVCRLGESSTERQLATRKLTIKSFSSHS